MFLPNEKSKREKNFIVRSYKPCVSHELAAFSFLLCMYARAACNALLGLLDLLMMDGMDRCVDTQGKASSISRTLSTCSVPVDHLYMQEIFLKLTLVYTAS